MRGSKFKYDWPRREDICWVDVQDVLREVVFEGPPPFALEAKQAHLIEEALQNH
jgi:hypothetical protein